MVTYKTNSGTFIQKKKNHDITLFVVNVKFFPRQKNLQEIIVRSEWYPCNMNWLYQYSYIRNDCIRLKLIISIILRRVIKIIYCFELIVNFSSYSFQETRISFVKLTLLCGLVWISSHSSSFVNCTSMYSTRYIEFYGSMFIFW